MYVKTVDPAQASGAVREMYDADLAEDGYVANYTRLFSLNPDAWQGWRTLSRAVRDKLSLRRYELATIAAAMALRCKYCVSAHTAKIETKLFTLGEVESIVRNYRSSPALEPVDVAIMAFAEKVALHAHRVTPADVDELRGFGLSDEEIFNVTLAAAMRAFFSKSLDAMGAQPDEALAATTPLFDLVYQPVAD